MYNVANGYGQKPSDFYELETDLGRWALDEACLFVGRRVENNLNNGKPALDGFGAKPDGNHGYRKTRSLVRKKVKIKADGTW